MFLSEFTGALFMIIYPSINMHVPTFLHDGLLYDILQKEFCAILYYVFTMHFSFI